MYRYYFSLTIVDPLLKEYDATVVNHSQPLSAQAQQAKLIPVVLYNICISFI